MMNEIIEEILTSSDKTKVFKKHNIIFAYMLKDAWSHPLRVVYVTSDKENNLHLIKELNDEIISTIDVEELNMALSNHAEKFDESKKIELPPVMVMDGYINEVWFKANDSWHNDSIDNMYYYDGKDFDENEHLFEVIGLLDDVYEVLYKNNKVIEEYFILCEPEDMEE